MRARCEPAWAGALKSWHCRQAHRTPAAAAARLAFLARARAPELLSMLDASGALTNLAVACCPFAGAYPFPLNAQVEGAWLGCKPDICSGDRHVLVRDNHTCLLYEGYSCRAPSSMSGKRAAGWDALCLA